jgi:Lysozyme like domain
VTNYTYSQLEQMWVNAGGSSALAPVMAAIALAESGGSSTAVNYNTNGTIDRGLWQINSIWGNLSTFDPTANAVSAVKVYQQQGLTAWATYNSGVYKQFDQGASGASVTSDTSSAASTPSSPNPGTSLNPAEALQNIGSLFHGVAQGLNMAFWIFQPGQGWRFIMLVGGVGSGIGAAKLYTSPSMSEEKSGTFPAAILLTGIALLCLYMTLRAWPVDSSGDAIRPAAYAVMILKGEKPPAGPPAPDNTGAIQLGLETLASIWIVSKVASGISGVAGAAGALGGIWSWLKGLLGGSGGGGELPEVPDVALSAPDYPGLSTTETV